MRRRFLRDFRDDLEDFGLTYAVENVWEDVVYPFKRFGRFLVKLKEYIPVLWDDFEFDYIYLLKIMRLKMKRMSEHMDEHGITVSSPRKARELRICTILIDRIIADDYIALQSRKLDEEYGELEFNSEPTGNPKLHRLILDRKGAREGTKEYEEETKKSRRIHKHAEYMKKTRP